MNKLTLNPVEVIRAMGRGKGCCFGGQASGPGTGCVLEARGANGTYCC
ncbi:hypothetical protein V6Z11_A02G178400 [Gossypium hirsutum]|uniref:Uncharacterized protein n=1 Tax=Gossypium darwinii TaxID=34276 RepID=A0A5D2HF70_GOSDA|nr:hypothetical protein ES288_A02G180800v1 [Gossypium darwinii]